MKRLENWFIGDYINAIPDYFEKAKVRLTFNLSLVIFVVLAVIYLP